MATRNWRTWMPLLQIRVPKALQRDLKRAAQERKTTVSLLVRSALWKTVAEPKT